VCVVRSHQWEVVVSVNEKLVQEAYAAFGRGDIGAVLDLLADDVAWSSPRTLPHGGVFQGKAEVGRFFEGIGTAWGTLGLDVERVSDAGDDTVIAVLRADGVRKNGQPASYGAVHVFEFRNGAIRRWREFVDVDAPVS
jgi:ketosteroid isomerase-like protein